MPAFPQSAPSHSTTLKHDGLVLLVRLDLASAASAWRQVRRNINEAATRFGTIEPSIYDAVALGRHSYVAITEMSDCFALRGMALAEGQKSVLTLPGAVRAPADGRSNFVVALPNADFHFLSITMLKQEAHLPLLMGAWAEHYIVACIEDHLAPHHDISYDIISTYGWPELCVVMACQSLGQLLDCSFELSERLTIDKLRRKLPDDPIHEEVSDYLDRLSSAGHRSLFSRSFTMLARGGLTGDAALAPMPPGANCDRVLIEWWARCVSGNQDWSAAHLAQQLAAPGIPPCSPWVGPRRMVGEADVAYATIGYGQELDSALCSMLSGTRADQRDLRSALYDIQANFSVPLASTQVSIANTRVALDYLRLDAGARMRTNPPALSRHPDPDVQGTVDLEYDQWRGALAKLEELGREGILLTQSILNEFNTGVVNHQLCMWYLPLRPAVESFLQFTLDLPITGPDRDEVIAEWREALAQFHEYFERTRAAIENATSYYIHSDAGGPPGAGPAAQRTLLAAWGIGAFVHRQAGIALPDVLCIPTETNNFTVQGSPTVAYVFVPRERQQRAEELWLMAHEFAHALIYAHGWWDLGADFATLVNLVSIIDRSFPHTTECRSLADGSIKDKLSMTPGSTALATKVSGAVIDAVCGVASLPGVPEERVKHTWETIGWCLQGDGWSELAERARSSHDFVADICPIDDDEQDEGDDALLEFMREVHSSALEASRDGEDDDDPISDLARILKDEYGRIAGLPRDEMVERAEAPEVEEAWRRLATALLAWAQGQHVRQQLLSAIASPAPDQRQRRLFDGAVRAFSKARPTLERFVFYGNESEKAEFAGELVATMGAYELFFSRVLEPEQPHSVAPLWRYAAASYGQRILHTSGPDLPTDTVFELWICWLWSTLPPLGASPRQVEAALEDAGLLGLGWDTHKAEASFRTFIAAAEQSAHELDAADSPESQVAAYLLRQVAAKTFDQLDADGYLAHAVCYATRIAIHHMHRKLSRVRAGQAAHAAAEAAVMQPIATHMLRTWLLHWPINYLLKRHGTGVCPLDPAAVKQLGDMLSCSSGTVDVAELLKVVDEERREVHPAPVDGDAIGRAHAAFMEGRRATPGLSAAQRDAHPRSRIVLDLWHYATTVLGTEFYDRIAPA